MREELIESMPTLLDLEVFSRRKTAPSNGNLEVEKTEVLRGTYLSWQERSLSLAVDRGSCYRERLPELSFDMHATPLWFSAYWISFWLVDTPL
jgi:hypothetical protein